LKKYYAATGRFPKTGKELIEDLREAGIDFPSLRDGWGMPYRALFGARVVYLVSNGPDRLPDTRDDYLAEAIHMP
jgi:hypothetical protein